MQIGACANFPTIIYQTNLNGGAQIHRISPPGENDPKLNRCLATPDGGVGR